VITSKKRRLNMNHTTNRYGIKTISMARGGFAALVIAALAFTSHVEAQRRAVPPPNALQGEADPAAGEALEGQGVVNIQTASADELQRLPGIGPSKAAAIIAQRERAAFRRVEDIMRVRGIGRATFRRLRTMLTVSGPTTLSEEVRSRRARPSPEVSGDEEEDG
jgi:competence protein ComEA